MERRKNSSAKNLVIVLLALVAISAGLIAYYQYQEKKQLVANLTEEQIVKQEKVMDAYARIEANLAKIREHEGLIQNTIKAKDKEGNANPEERIQQEIQIIERIMQENREIIATLNEEVNLKDNKLKDFERHQKNLNTRIGEYKAIVGDLTAKNEALQKDIEVIELAKTHLENDIQMLDSQITEKAAQLAAIEEELLKREDEMHQAYYTVGTFKDLRDQQIVEKEGGILGIASVKTLNEDFDPGQFKQVDTRNINEIPVKGEKIEIVTNQDPDTYSLEYEGDIVERIVIEKPAEFWEKSKSLVVVVKDKHEGELAEAGNQ